MSHRLPLLVFGLLAVVAAGCTDDITPSTCVIQTYRIEGTPLTLLPDARIDRVGDRLGSGNFVTTHHTDFHSLSSNTAVQGIVGVVALREARVARSVEDEVTVEDTGVGVHADGGVERGREDVTRA